MAEEKSVSLREKFKKVIPSGEKAVLFERSIISKLMFDSVHKIVEIRCELPRYFSKDVLYSAEEEIAETYGLNLVRILPHYPREVFSAEQLPGLFREAGRFGAVTEGFFSEMDSHIDGNTVIVRIPFDDGGVYYLDLAGTSKAVETIIKNEYSLDLKVKIEQADDFSEKNRYFFEKQNSIIEKQKAKILENAARAAEEKNKEASEEKTGPELKKIASLFDGSGEVTREGYTVKCGLSVFDVSDPVSLLGSPFAIENVSPLSTLNKPAKGIITLGEVFAVSSRETKRNDKTAVTVSLTDKASSMYLKIMVDRESSDEILNLFSVGKSYAIRGNVKVDTYDNDTYLQYTDVMEVKKVVRNDNAPEKRIELHLHTNMSAMDAIPTAESVVKLAHNWGHPAVAITDHGNLQNFPAAMLAAEKINDLDFKVIYGVEAYFVDDTLRAATNGENVTFEDEFVVFDIETTGLSPINCKIIEIGAVTYCKGRIISRFNEYVDPECHIPDEITKLTGISDDTVKGSDTIEKVLPAFLDYCGDRMLVAHNASFDTGFIRASAEKIGVPFGNPYLDTLALSRYLNPTLTNHKLDTLAKNYALGDFDHHRASEDAEMLSMIFDRMLNRLNEEGIHDVAGMNYVMSEKADPLKLKTYHQIILVKNQTGLRNLYKLVSDSYLKYFRRYPRILKTQLSEAREGLIIGSACEAGELFRAVLENRPDDEIDEIASFYDYIEIQPVSNNEFLIGEGRVADEEGLRNLNRRLCEIADRNGLPVVATCDVHYIDPEDEIFRRILLSGMKYSDADRPTKLFFRTTEEMLEEFAYLGEEKAKQVVIDNPRKIASMIENVRPIPKGKFDPHIEGAEEELTESCYSLAHELYGDPLPEIVAERLDRELKSIIGNGFAVMYIIARKLVLNSESKGYQVGSRGSVGSSFVATMSGITLVNPLPPHYRCPGCKYSDFSNPTGAKSGFDLPPLKCPKCGTDMVRDGHDIPFETFLGFKGDKVPDIDLNFSGDVQADAHKFTEVLFGEGHAFRAGTIGALADKTAYGFTVKYLEDRGIMVNRAEIDRLISGCVGVKRTTGQHPGGIIIVPGGHDVYEFCPVQHPADDADSSIITTHFEFKYLHDTILKLDILGHDIPTKYKRLEEYSGTNILDVPMSDPEVYKLFTSTDPIGVTPQQINSDTGTLGLPEMGTRFIRGVLMESQPTCFADLLQISGLTHGTNVWIGNADELIRSGTCTIKDVIGCRDDIMLTLIHEFGLDNFVAFKIMEDVRKGKGLTPEYESVMKEHGVPDWYIDSCKKIKYMFPKAHAAAYVMDALRLGWYKINYPTAFYAAYFTAAPDGFNGEIVSGGMSAVNYEISRISKLGKEASAKENDTLDALALVNECMQRGYRFLPVDFKKSDAHRFIPENGSIRMPFDSLPGVGASAAESIATARDSGEVFSIEDLKMKSGVTKAVLEVLDKNGVTATLPKSDQVTMF
ncbi:MAG: PolC-type DNA polymerase III [Clostridia bacterium]|nr:PolC-type DNA polymerase III [Clostridia bacterium]